MQVKKKIQYDGHKTQLFQLQQVKKNTIILFQNKNLRVRRSKREREKQKTTQTYAHSKSSFAFIYF